MTVKELRTILLTYPDDMEVRRGDAEWGPTELTTAFVEEVETGGFIERWRHLVTGKGSVRENVPATRPMLVLD